MKPGNLPFEIVLEIQSRPIGPTGAAMEMPMIAPLMNSVISSMFIVIKVVNKKHPIGAGC